MVDLDAIQTAARHCLVLRTVGGGEDTHLWDHTMRVVRGVKAIVHLEALESRVDCAVLMAAAFFHDAGWVVQLEGSHTASGALLTRSTSSGQRELGAGLMEKSLADILPADKLQAASSCIRALNDRKAESLEARLIVAADALDECGPLCMWQMIHKHASDKRGVSGMLEAWETKKRYSYWNALIKDAIQFDSARGIAMKRLEILDRIFADLKCTLEGMDLDAALQGRSAAE